jgi:nicotinamidase-related amidase
VFKSRRAHHQEAILIKFEGCCPWQRHLSITSFINRNPLKGGNNMKAKETAVVLIEFQNDFCKDGGKLNAGVKSELARQKTIPNAVKLAEGARKKGALVIHSPFVFNEKYFKDHQMQGIVKAVADGGALRDGTWGTEIIDELKPQKGDKVVSGKCTLCGFNNTDLEKILKANNIKNVVIGGFLTNFCVESTARSAYDRGYSVTIMKDATAANSKEEQDHSENKIFPLLGQTLSVDQFLAQLEE